LGLFPAASTRVGVAMRVGMALWYQFAGDP
jgi:hypothetical protein